MFKKILKFLGLPRPELYSTRIVEVTTRSGRTFYRIENYSYTDLAMTPIWVKKVDNIRSLEDAMEKKRLIDLNYVNEKIIKTEVIENSVYAGHKNNTQFSTKEAAEERDLINRPCLSIKEIAPLFGRYYGENHVDTLDKLTHKLKELVKTKLL